MVLNDRNIEMAFGMPAEAQNAPAPWRETLTIHDAEFLAGMKIDPS